MKRLGGWLFRFALKLISRQKKVRKFLRVFKIARFATRLKPVQRALRVLTRRSSTPHRVRPGQRSSA